MVDKSLLTRQNSQLSSRHLELKRGFFRRIGEARVQAHGAFTVRTLTDLKGSDR